MHICTHVYIHFIVFYLKHTYTLTKAHSISLTHTDTDTCKNTYTCKHTYTCTYTSSFSLTVSLSNTLLLVGCLTSQQQASVSQGRICSDNFTCCHTEIEVADQTFYLTQSQYTDTRPTSPSADPITPGTWQGSHWSTNF